MKEYVYDNNPAVEYFLVQVAKLTKMTLKQTRTIYVNTTKALIQEGLLIEHAEMKAIELINETINKALNEKRNPK